MTEAEDILNAAVEAGEEVKRSIVEAVRLADEERAKLTGQVQDDRRGDAPPERQLTTDQVQQDRRDDEPQNRGNIQQDRRDDEPQNRDNIQQDRRDDELQNRGNIQQDRRDDEVQNRDNIQQDRRDDEVQNRDHIQQDRRDDELQNRGNIQQDRRDDEQGNRDSIQQDRRDDEEQVRGHIQQDRRDDEAPRTALELVRADKLTHSLVLLETVRKMCIALLLVMVVLGATMIFMFDYMGDSRQRIDNLQDEIVASNEATDRVDASVMRFNDNNQTYLDNHARTQRLICAWFKANNMAPPDNGDCDNR